MRLAFWIAPSTRQTVRVNEEREEGLKTGEYKLVRVTF